LSGGAEVVEGFAVTQALQVLENALREALEAGGLIPAGAVVLLEEVGGAGVQIPAGNVEGVVTLRLLQGYGGGLYWLFSVPSQYVGLECTISL
jgi:hypothetical protein